jgi:magnesium-transporting ATPase (P-type)
VASAGILALICRWFPKFKARVISERAVNPAFANMLLIKSAWGDSEIVELIQSDPDSKKENIPFFVYKSARFAYDRQENRFVYFSDKEIFKPNFLRCEGGLSDAQVEHRSAMFGENLIDIFEPSWFALLIQEILHPFFVFQIFSIIIWGIELYFNYAIAVLIISIITVATSLYQTKRVNI